MIERNADTLSHTHCSLIAATRGPTQVPSAHHTQSSRAKLTCSSTAAWLSPMLLPNTPFCFTAAACSVPCPPAASAKQNVPVTSRQASSERTKLICAACSLGAAPSKYPVELLPASHAMTLSWFGLVSLQTSVSPVRISLRHVAHLQHTKQATR